LLAQRKVLEHQFVVAAAGQGERSRDPEDGSQHWVIVSCETCENQHGSRAGCTSGVRERADADVRALARLIEVTLRGSFLNWTLYREGSAADWLREDLDDMLRPHLMRGDNRRRRRI
jgi:hypothetical protein